MEPGVHPSIAPRSTESKAERAVFDALRRQLPKGWYAWHSLAVRTADGDESEADFIIAAPGRGLLVLEVKGGQIQVNDGRWLQNGRPIERPLDQAFRAARTIARRLEEKKIKPPPWGVCAAFPDVAFGSSSIGMPDDVATRVLSGYQLNYLNEALPELLSRALAGAPVAPPSNSQWIAALHDLWGERWVPQLRLGERAVDDDAERVRIDAQQFLFLDVISSNRRVLVTGEAGTGKTLLAREAAVRAAATGKRALLLCFTEALAHWLAEGLRDSGVKVSALYPYAAEILTRAAKPIPEQKDRAFWDQVLERALGEGHEGIAAQNWDVVILDEAQDLDDGSWLFVLELARGERSLWAFCDPSQKFWGDRSIPDCGWTNIPLRRAYRSHDSILNLARLYQGLDADLDSIRGGVAEGRIGVASTTGALDDALNKEIGKLCAEQFSPGQIAIVSAVGRQKNPTVATRDKLGPYRLVRADSPESASNLVADTFLRIKGLEKRAVIVTDLSLIGPSYEKTRQTRMYIAITRAQDAVRFVDTESGLRSDRVLRELFPELTG